MNSEKSYDSLPNFTAADCEFLLFQSLFLPEVVCNPTLAFSPTLIYTWHNNVCAQTPHTHLMHSLLQT